MVGRNNNRLSPPASEASSWSRISVSTANPDQARVFVKLENGKTILVPLPQTSTVHDLHEKALQRAERFGFQGNVNDSFLQTTRAPAISLCGEDSLIDVLDLTDDSTFNLHSLRERPSQASSSVTRSSISEEAKTEDQALVFVRWITLEDAVSHSQLSKIMVDSATVPEHTTLDEFYKMAAARYADPFITGLKRQPRKVNLYLKDCRLGAENNAMSFRDLNLVGTRAAPLDVFVDLDYSHEATYLENLTSDTELESLWGFPTTKRGVCALTTSMKIVVTELASDNQVLEDFLKVLFELMHFPPLLLAVKNLRSPTLGSRSSASYLRMVAYALHVICLQTAPSWVCSSPEMALESSRQVLAWMLSLRPTSKLKNNEKGSLLGRLQIREEGAQLPLSTTLQYVHNVQILILSQSGSNEVKQLEVALNNQDETTATFLGRAIHKASICGIDFYLNIGTDWSQLVHHKKVPTLQPTEFDVILQTTALSPKLRMVGPQQLGDCLASQLPVVTLSSAGYVSMYEQEYYECSEKRFFTWNAIQKKEIMTHANPGQYLTQKLEPIIAERKKEGTWATDAWNDWTKAIDFGTPEEAIVVCMDTSGSMSTCMPSGWLSVQADVQGTSLTRLTEVKEFFKNLAMRVSALRLPTYLGLVTFSSRAQIAVKQELTPVHLNFEDQMEDIKSQSSTALFDGLDKSQQMLCELKKMHPEVKCRIILLTDGEDNASTCLPETVARNLFSNNIVLDSVVIGTNSTRDLFKISRMTGGYAFAPKTQQTFFQIFLLETVVDIRTRPDIVKTACDYPQTWATFSPKIADMSDPFNFPPCRPHPNQNDYFIALRDADRFLTRQTRQINNTSYSPSVRSMSTRSTSTAMTGTTLGSAGGSARTILAEIKEMINNPHEYMDVYVSESNMGFWKVAMQGPPASPYANGVFLLYLEIGQDFPLKPPSARFITPVLHPNITKVC